MVTKSFFLNKVVFSFPKENISIEVDSVNAPNGSKGVLYDCFLVALGQWHKQGMSEDDFIKDIRKVINLVTSGHSDEEVIGTLLAHSYDAVRSKTFWRQTFYYQIQKHRIGSSAIPCILQRVHKKQIDTT